MVERSQLGPAKNVVITIIIIWSHCLHIFYIFSYLAYLCSESQMQTSLLRRVVSEYICQEIGYLGVQIHAGGEHEVMHELYPIHSTSLLFFCGEAIS